MATLQPSSTKEAPSLLPEPPTVEPTAALPSPPKAAEGIAVAPKPSPSQTKLVTLEILEVQRRLESLGMKPGPFDGFFGPLLAAAIRRYEEARGRPAIGNVDRELLERLRQETNELIPQAPRPGSKKP
jgi:peptidoglycan hydrolase-like protein with peptidoglycan-binding domain